MFGPSSYGIYHSPTFIVFFGGKNFFWLVVHDQHGQPLWHMSAYPCIALLVGTYTLIYDNFPILDAEHPFVR